MTTILNEDNGMRMKTSEILDRWTILRMQARLDERAERELASYDDAVMDLYEQHASKTGTVNFLTLMLSLQEANSKIWENEAAIRKQYSNDVATAGISNEDNSESLIEIGRRALAIREHNKMRVSTKQNIDMLFGDLPGIKVDHVSEPDGTYDVRIVRADMMQKISIIKVIRELTGRGLRESKDMVDNLPSDILYGISKQQAMDAQRRLENEGASILLVKRNG